MNVGGVYWIQLPARGGHEQAGRRPGIIVQTDAASQRLPTTLLVPLTTQLDALRFPGAVLIEPDAEYGLRRASVALMFQLAVVDKRALGSRLGTLPASKLAELWRAFDVLTGRSAAP